LYRGKISEGLRSGKERSKFQSSGILLKEKTHCPKKKPKIEKAVDARFQEAITFAENGTGIKNRP